MPHYDRFYEVPILQLNCKLSGRAILRKTAVDNLGCEGDEAAVGVGEEIKKLSREEVEILLGTSGRYVIF